MAVRLGMPTVRDVSAGEAAAALAARASDAPGSGGLVDTFGRLGTDLRISLTDKCNLRCTYCMPAEGMDWMPQSSLLTVEEVRRLVKIAVDELGVRELRLTGGEPLVRPDLEEIIAAVRADHPQLPVSITTNAIGLDRRAASLAAAGLDRINVSLDTVDAETYRQMARRDRLAPVLRGIEAAQDAGLRPVKINAVLMRGANDDQAVELLSFCLARGLELRFIEQMPLDGDHGWTREGMVTAGEIREQLSARWRLDPDDVPRDGAPAQRWIVREAGTGALLGRVGIIASVTEPFCTDCTRTRLTAEGRIRTCLFSHEEFDLLGLLRAGHSDAKLAQMWRQATWLKPAAHGMNAPGLGGASYVQPERSMSAIGG
ncbi:GTP 3',8-cyclase MoaA [Nesterenkonia aerolata]|uniref:GTP 3',8-cyclase n=1 Tax=Nesterenkonia aerolata TaxID=3074079 RepID=A0ABU2DSI1_9MICC|nr:GTP 3',8-cyclase MoaA [Nesterenkonia sp. LY-0111]MDR8019460.1 GTP 3',8-cyclase MoaA [Nesterenkonia sp. LY-0111]